MNKELHQAREILARNGGCCIRQDRIDQNEIERPEILLEFWTSQKGMVILQSWQGERGVSTFWEFGMGGTMDEFEAAIKASPAAKPKVVVEYWGAEEGKPTVSVDPSGSIDLHMTPMGFITTT